MDSFLSCPSLIFILAACLVYLLGTAICRLYLSPVSHIPGPRLAVLTFWYEFYYDVVLQGQYSFKIQQLHQIYGPVVRINPEEVHVSDPEFYDQVYVGSSRRTEKWPFSARMFGTELATVGTIGHELHRARRSTIGPYFSKRQVDKSEETVRNVVDHACQRLATVGQEGNAVNLRDFFAAVSADVIGSFAFGKSYGLLDKPEFEPGWQRLMMDLSRGTHLMKQFPWVYWIVMMLPDELISFVHPLTKRLFDIRKELKRMVVDTQGLLSGADSRDTPKCETVVHSLLTSPGLHFKERSTLRVEEETFTLLGAGTISTAHTLTTIMYHILANPGVKGRLEEELKNLSLTPPNPTLDHLKQAPYLSAVTSEGLRLAFGVSQRLPRISPDITLHYRGTADKSQYEYAIPPGTPVSMTQMFIHLDPSIFLDPHTFAPERWLSSPCDLGMDEHLQRMKHFLIPFSKGTRMCVGMHLAYAEIYLILYSLFSPEGLGKRLELFETGREDVDCKHDFFNPSSALGSKGVRVKIG
ncbi:putative P450 monooxygenase [Polyplosphaeria fusca]|uniref:P450 monooxygenase n=1 Tax=Polyplosphaeria fusca TaxID=682080 RepID=A0A9P4QK55_9PLEO|nr:putative P450 monooxygenase [Polyplosphaeria fusca]